ncbi:MAG: hypothetical protein V4478_01600 [Patescibacteria group bacterium]
MKKKLLQLLVLAPALLLVAGLAAAYTPPVSLPPQGNTDAPLDIGTANQIKDGDLGVAAFEARGNAYLAKDVFFNGMIRGGTPADKDSAVAFGGAANKVSVLVNGTASIIGHYQSDTLKTPSGNKEPVCADANGVFYLCGASAGPAPVNPVYVSIDYQTPGSTNVVAHLSEGISSQVTVYIQASSGSAAPMSFLQKYFTANAYYQDACQLTSTPTVLGSVTIPHDQTVSNNVITLPNGCSPSSTYISISSYSPQSTVGGRPIESY